MKWTILGLALLVVGLGCGKKPEPVAEAEHTEAEEVPAAEQPYVDAARPFAEAIAARQYDRSESTRLNSSHSSVSRMPSSA